MIASIEAPFALLEKQVKILRFDAIKATHMRLGLIPKILDSIDVIGSLSEELAIIYTTMMKGAQWFNKTLAVVFSGRSLYQWV